MHCKRGDVILVRFPNSDLKTFKKRPALLIQADGLNTGIDQKLAAIITSNLSRTGPTRIHIRKDSHVGRQMGLLGDSVIMADNIATILDREMDKVVGRCNEMQRVDAALRITLAL
jgi:mRNA interferase MazF